MPIVTRFHFVLRFFLGLILLAAIGCAQGSSSDDDDGSDSTDGGSTTEAGSGGDSTTGPGTAFRSLCGAVIDGQLVNPVPNGFLESVQVEPLQPDTVIITRLGGPQAGNPQLVKLHGISAAGVPAFLNRQGLELIRQLTAGGAFFAGAGSIPDALGNPVPCQIGFDGGGLGTAGQVYASSGENISEALLLLGAATPANDSCGSELLQSCYSGIEPIEQISSITIRDFLWKPQSERDGNLAVLVGPSNISVFVNGQRLNNSGPSNGRGTTGRAGVPGGAFGTNVQVTFEDSQGRTVLLANGERVVVIPNGSQRVEFVL